MSEHNNDDWQKYYHDGTSKSEKQAEKQTSAQKAKAEYEANLKKVTNGCLSIVLVIVALSFLASLFPKSRPNRQTVSTSPSTRDISNKKPEELLAIIDRSPSNVAPYAATLDKLELKCTENRMKIADMSAATQDIIAKKTIRPTNLELIQGVLTVTNELDSVQDCDQYFAAFAILMTSD
ncbi:hypothetical protein [Thalassoporum mexicanum]|uniref:hypothetical protein n=1 Tax=Thalassoporum mexicanum TaxID=3457544 RepID=UPI0012EADE0D|nr:hypothetical protein [Pseudanabaena sp. PCC 7367]